MSKRSEKTKEKTEPAAEPAEEAQEVEAKAEEKSVEAQGASEKAEDKPADTQEASPKAEDKSEAPKAKSAKVEAKPAVAKEKPLEKMTVKELREMAKGLSGIAGVHAMKKDELLVAIKKAKGIQDEPVKKADASIRDLKQKISALKGERQAALEAKDKKKATIFRRRISRLKKKTRRAAA